MSLKVLELFCGAGSFSTAMNSLNIEHEIVGFSDIRETAIELFCKLHDKNPEDNLGDIKTVSAKNMDVDLLVFGSPCQSYTRAGKLGGGTKGSNTKSALMWEAVRIMEECKPKYIIWENVPDAINKRHINNFEEYVEDLSDLGYNTYYEILNAHELGSAQKRKRLFSISIRKDIDNGKFKFIHKIEKAKDLHTYLETVEEPDYANEKVHSDLILGVTTEGVKIKNGTKLGYLYANEGDIIDLSYTISKVRRGRVQKNACQTLMRSKTLGTLQNGKLRYLTPKEYWNLQEMPDELYKYVEECNFSDRQKYDVVGGVINQKHLETVFTSLKEAFNW